MKATHTDFVLRLGLAIGKASGPRWVHITKAYVPDVIIDAAPLPKYPLRVFIETSSFESVRRGVSDLWILYSR